MGLIYLALNDQVNLMQNINEIQELVKLISKLPGLGKKSAQRIVLKLINSRDELMRPMTNTLAKVYKNISRCKSCGTLKSNSNGCTNCEIVNKKFNKICVVENVADQLSIENSSIYQGYFHILGGTLSSSKSQRKEDLLVSSLVERVKKDKIDEVIIATSATVEGQTTAYYIQNSLRGVKNLKVSKLGQGMNVGSEIQDLEDGTLLSAFKNRTEIKNNLD